MGNEHFGMYIDPVRHIIAAGPIRELNAGMLGYIYTRSVVRWMPNNQYCTVIETLDRDGNHKDFDEVTSKMHDGFPAKYFGKMMVEENDHPLYHS